MFNTISRPDTAIDDARMPSVRGYGWRSLVTAMSEARNWSGSPEPGAEQIAGVVTWHNQIYSQTLWVWQITEQGWTRMDHTHYGSRWLIVQERDSNRNLLGEKELAPGFEWITQDDMTGLVASENSILGDGDGRLVATHAYKLSKTRESDFDSPVFTWKSGNLIAGLGDDHSGLGQRPDEDFYGDVYCQLFDALMAGKRPTYEELLFITKVPLHAAAALLTISRIDRWLDCDCSGRKLK